MLWRPLDATTEIDAVHGVIGQREGLLRLGENEPKKYYSAIHLEPGQRHQRTVGLALDVEGVAAGTLRELPGGYP